MEYVVCEVRVLRRSEGIRTCGVVHAWIHAVSAAHLDGSRVYVAIDEVIVWLVHRGEVRLLCAHHQVIQRGVLHEDDWTWKDRLDVYQREEGWIVGLKHMIEYNFIYLRIIRGYLLII